MKVSGRMIKLMDMESICTLMEQDTKDIGKRINSMVEVKKHGLMVHAMKVNILKERKMELDTLSGLMDQHIRVNLLIITFTGEVCMYGQMRGDMMVNG